MTNFRKGSGEFPMHPYPDDAKERSCTFSYDQVSRIVMFSLSDYYAPESTVRLHDGITVIMDGDCLAALYLDIDMIQEQAKGKMREETK